MPATSKSELLAVNELEFEKLQKTLRQVDAALAETATDEDGITIKDTIAHRTHWIDLFLGWYRDGRSGQSVQTPAPGYKWNQLKEYNAKVRAESRSEPWPDVLQRFSRANDELTGLLQSLDEQELYTKNVYDWTNTWTVGRWAEASGASHYRSANKHIRKILKSAKSGS